MEVSSSFSSRRSAAGSLPPFSLPPPNEVPSMALFTHRPSSPFGLLPSSPLTSSPGASDGLSPGMSSVNTASSQGSQAHGNMQYTYSTNVHGTWPTPGNSNYSVGTTSPDQSYGHRSSIYGQPPSMGYGNPRSSQSPATGGEGLPPPPFNNVHQPFQTSISGGGGNGGQDNHHMSSQAPPQGAMLNSTQPHTPGSAPAPVDPYAHSRPPSNPSYYTASSTPQQASFPSYAGHQQPSPTGTSPGSRGMGHPMAPPPGSYRPYGSYQPLATMNGPVMSNIHQPGSQLSMIPAMGVPPGYNAHQMMYGHHHAQPQPQSERPFKCDQCTQSFSRNHDLKRHKRIHLAVKPFPCSFCSKSFSRKDALKVRNSLSFSCNEFISQ